MAPSIRPRWLPLSHSLSVFATAILLCAASIGAPPETINYQGRLTQPDGAPASGLLTIAFRLFDAHEAGDLLWTEIHEAVNVDDGIFNVPLGKNQPFADAGVDFDEPYYLEIELDGEVFTPRVPLRSVPYARLAAAVADGAVTGTAIADKAVGRRKIADGAVTGAKIADRAVDPSKIADNAIAGNHIQDETISGDDILDASIPDDKLQTLSSPDKVDGAAVRLDPDGGLSVTELEEVGALALNLDGDTLTVTQDGLRVGTLTDADIPDTITAEDYLPLAGGALSGTLHMDGNALTGLPEPAEDGEPVPLSLLKQQTEAASWKASVRAATAGPIAVPGDLQPFPGAGRIDGVELQAGDRVLVKDQDDPVLNGIYEVSVLTAGDGPKRTADFDAADEIAGAAMLVREGETNGNTAWMCITDGLPEPDTDTVRFAALTGGDGGSYAAGDGLNLAGSVFSVHGADLAGFGLAEENGDLRVRDGLAGAGLRWGQEDTLDLVPGPGLQLDGDYIALAVRDDTLNVSGDGLAVGQLSVDNLAKDSVTGQKIAANAVAAEHLDTGAVTAAKLAAAAVNGTHIQDETITDSDIAPAAAIAKSKIAGLTDALDEKLEVAEKAAPGGVADLDAEGFLPLERLPLIPDQRLMEDYLSAHGGTLQGELSMANNPIRDLGEPQQPGDAVPMEYVESRQEAFSWKQSVRVATTGPVDPAADLMPGTLIDEVDVGEGDRVLVKDQTHPEENGIYIVSSQGGLPAKDMDSFDEAPGAAVFVRNGTTFQDTLWMCITDSIPQPGGKEFKMLFPGRDEVDGFGLDWGEDERLHVVANDLAGDGLTKNAGGQLEIAQTLEGRILSYGTISGGIAQDVSVERANVTDSYVGNSTIDSSDIGSNRPASGTFTSMKVTESTESTDPLTGAATVNGGMGVGGNLHVGGNADVGGRLKAANMVESAQISITSLEPFATYHIEHAEIPDFGADSGMKRIVQVYYQEDPPFGDGSDGDFAVTSAMEQMALESDMNFEDLTVEAGAVLNTAGHTVRVRGTCRVYGTIIDSYSGGWGGYGGGGGEGGRAQTGPDGEYGQHGDKPEQVGPGQGGRGGNGGGGGGGQSLAEQIAQGGWGGAGGEGGQGGGVVRLYCARLENYGLIHANGTSGQPGTQGDDVDPAYQVIAEGNADVAAGAGGGGQGGDGGGGGFVDIIVADEQSVLGEETQLQAKGGAGGIGGEGGNGAATQYDDPGGTEYSGGEGHGPAPNTGDGGSGETGSDGSGNGARGADGVHGDPGIVRTTVWQGGSLVQALPRKIRVVLHDPDTTVIRNDTEKTYSNVRVNIVYPPYDDLAAGSQSQ